jgi:hypothetical protein
MTHSGVVAVGLRPIRLLHSPCDLIYRNASLSHSPPRVPRYCESPPIRHAPALYGGARSPSNDETERVETRAVFAFGDRLPIDAAPTKSLLASEVKGE